MCNDYDAATDEILKAIQYGLMPIDEIEKRLQGIVEQELSGSIDAEYNREKVELCNSLLQQIYTNQKIDFPMHSEAIKAQIMEKHLAYKRRNERLKRSICAAAAVFCLFGVLQFSHILPLKLFPENLTLHTEVQEPLVNAKTIALANLEDAESVILSSSSLQYADAVAFLGYDPAMPQNVDNAYEMETCSILVIPDVTVLSCGYGEENDIQFTKTFFTNMREASLLFEENKVGDYLDINNLSVYCYTQAGYQCYLWYGNATIHSLIVKGSSPHAYDILENVLNAEKISLSNATIRRNQRYSKHRIDLILV